MHDLNKGIVVESTCLLIVKIIRVVVIADPDPYLLWSYLFLKTQDAKYNEIFILPIIMNDKEHL